MLKAADRLRVHPLLGLSSRETSDREAHARGEEAWEGVSADQRDTIESKFFASLLTYLKTEGAAYFVADLPFHGESETLVRVATTTGSRVTERNREVTGELNNSIIEAIVQLNPAVLTLRDANRDRLYVTDSWTTADVVLDGPGMERVEEMVGIAHTAARRARQAARASD